MPIENMADEGLAKNPDLQLAQWKFMLTTDKYKSDHQIKNQTMTSITKDSKLLKSCAFANFYCPVSSITIIDALMFG